MFARLSIYPSAGVGQQADTLLATTFEDTRDEMPEAIRPALETRPESVELHELVHRDY